MADNITNALFRGYCRLGFGAPDRVAFYESLGFLLMNNKPLRVALSDMRDVATDFGKKTHPLAILLTELMDALADNRAGHTFESVLAEWVPVEEAGLINAGLVAGMLPDALKRAIVLIEGRQRIKGAVVKATLYPLLLSGMAVAMLYTMAGKLIPQLEKLSDPATWTGSMATLAALTGYLMQYGWLTLAGLAAVLFVVFWSQPRLTGTVRHRVLDLCLPWSVYRDIQGAVFLLNVAALMRANLQTLPLLARLSQHASPWLRERLTATAARVGEGEHLGKALRNTGFDFPSRECVNQLYLLTDGDGAEDIMEKFGERWLDTTVKRVERRAVMLNGMAVLMLLSFFGLVMGAIFQIQSMADAAM